MTLTSILAAAACLVLLAAFAVSVKRVERLAERPGPHDSDLLWPMLQSLILLGCVLAAGSAI